MSISVSSEHTRSYVEVKPHLARLFVGIYLDLENYLNYCAIVLITYDFLLTLGREIWHVWRARQSFATLLFYGIRYPALFNVVLTLLVRMSWPSFQNNWVSSTSRAVHRQRMAEQSTHSCGVLEHVQMALDIIILVSSTIFGALRVYAMFNRGWLLFCLVLVFGLLNPAISIYIFKRTLTTLDAYQNLGACMLTIIGNERSYENWMIGARAASVMSDGIVLALTVVKTYKKTHRPDEAADLAPSLSQILLRDTVLCFSLLCVVNVIGMATGHLTQFIGIWQTWTAALTSILLSRLALDLREISVEEEDSCEFTSLGALGSNFSSEPYSAFTETEEDMLHP